MALLATARRAGLTLCVGFCAGFAAFGAVVLAFGLRLQLTPAVSDFSSLIPHLVALEEMMIAGVGKRDAWLALVVFLLIMLAPMVLPTVLVFVAPKRADTVLGPVRRVLQKHGTAIIAAVCFVIAVYLAEKGIRGL
jgi:hypothetical protein